jgi:hypothetical protein
MKRSRNPRYLKQYRDPANVWINQYRRNGRLVRLPNGRDFTDEFWTAYYAAERAVLGGTAKSPREHLQNPGARDHDIVCHEGPGAQGLGDEAVDAGDGRV